jgi:hypothetical protein
MKGLFGLRNEFLMELVTKRGFWMEWNGKRVVLLVVEGSKERYWMRFLRGMVTDRNKKTQSKPCSNPLNPTPENATPGLLPPSNRAQIHEHETIEMPSR